MAEYDRTMVFMPLLEAQRYFSRGSEVDAIEMVVNHPENIDTYVREAKRAAGPTHHVSDWRARNETFFTVLEVERNVMFIILSLIVLVAALNIISGLMMLVKDKGRDVAILRTMGATRGAMMRVFLITGASIGIVGTLAGLILGIVFCLNIERIRELISWMTSTTLFDPNVYYLTRLPADMEPRETATIVLHGARRLRARHALSVLARFHARSGGGSALRMSDRMKALAEELQSVRDAALQPVLRLDRLVRTFHQGARTIAVLNGASCRHLPRAGGGAGRAVRRRQVDAAAHRRAARDARRRPRRHRRPGLHRHG